MHPWMRERAPWEEWRQKRWRENRGVGDGAGGAQAAVRRGIVQKTRDAVVYPAQEEGRGQREDAPRIVHSVRGVRESRRNRRRTPWASQGRAGGERSPRGEGTQMQTPGKAKQAEGHVAGPADAVAAGSRAGVGWRKARRRSTQEGPGGASRQVGAYHGARGQEAGQDCQARAKRAGCRQAGGSSTLRCGRSRGPKSCWTAGQQHIWGARTMAQRGPPRAGCG